VELPINQCEGNPIAAQYELGKEMGVSGTPAIVTSSGELIPGYRPAAALVALLGLD
jgi:thiol:disulfide interchange protein DsbC